MDRHIKQYKDDIGRMFREASKHSPKKFWKILNGDKVDDDNNIDIDIFFNFFKSLNELEPEVTEIEPIDNNIQLNCEILNNVITKEEVTAGIKQLKRSKASGLDHIENEYLIEGCELLSPLLVELFNLVFEQSTLPDSWLTGIIKPIYKKKGDVTDPTSPRW